MISLDLDFMFLPFPSYTPGGWDNNFHTLRAPFYVILPLPLENFLDPLEVKSRRILGVKSKDTYMDECARAHMNTAIHHNRY